MLYVGDDKYKVYVGSSAKKIQVSEYTELEYIFTTGNCAIDTGILPSNTLTIECSYECYGRSTYTTLFGTRTNLDTNSFAYQVSLGSNTSNTRFQYGNSKDSNNVKVNYKRAAVIKLDKGVCYVDSEQVGDMSSLGVFNNPKSIILCGENQNGNISPSFCGKIFYFKVWDNDILIRNYIPVKNKSGICGFFDTINNVFYTSCTETEFRDYEYSSIITYSNEMGLEYENGNYSVNRTIETYANVCIKPIPFTDSIGYVEVQKPSDGKYITFVKLDSSKKCIEKTNGNNNAKITNSYISAIFWDRPALTYPESIDWSIKLYIL